MKKSNKVILPMVIALLFSLTQAAYAGNVCSADIVNAQADINLNADGFLSKRADKDIAGLLGKLDATDSKLDQGKADDARQKIGDALAKLDQLINAGKPKISGDAYTIVSNAVVGVLDCIDANYR